MKEPAARLVHTIPTMSPAPLATIPIITPRGEAHEKIKMSHLTVVKSSGNVLTNEIPRALEAAPLWMTIAITIYRELLKSVSSPRARPSKQACTDRAIINMKGVMLHEQQPFFFSTISISSPSATLFPN